VQNHEETRETPAKVPCNNRRFNGKFPKWGSKIVDVRQKPTTTPLFGP